MNHASDRTPAGDCARIKKLGYSTSHHIKMYGERCEIVSEPFSEGTGVAVRAITSKDSAVRTLHLPVAILVGLADRFLKAA